MPPVRRGQRRRRQINFFYPRLKRHSLPSVSISDPLLSSHVVLSHDLTSRTLVSEYKAIAATRLPAMPNAKLIYGGIRLHSCSIIISREGEAVGGLTFRLVRTQKPAPVLIMDVLLLAIAPDFQTQGIGTLLVHKALRVLVACAPDYDVHNAYLLVQADIASIGFWAKQGLHASATARELVNDLNRQEPNLNPVYDFTIPLGQQVPLHEMTTPCCTPALEEIAATPAEPHGLWLPKSMDPAPGKMGMSVMGGAVQLKGCMPQNDDEQSQHDSEPSACDADSPVDVQHIPPVLKTRSAVMLSVLNTILTNMDEEKRGGECPYPSLEADDRIAMTPAGNSSGAIDMVQASAAPEDAIVSKPMSKDGSALTPVDGPQGEPWACKRCTFVNIYLRVRCSMCMSYRPGACHASMQSRELARLCG